MLKCWRKRQDNEGYLDYKNAKQDKIIIVSKNVFESQPNFGEWKYTLLRGNKGKPIKKHFKTRAEATKLAKNYMKEHDTC